VETKNYTLTRQISDMVSRERVVHASAVFLGILVLLAAESVFDIGSESPVLSGAVIVLFYGLVLGGAHLYFALRGEDGIVPVESRWRYVALLAVLLGSGAVAAYGQDTAVGPLDLRSVGVATLAILAYVVSEVTSGYRSSQSR
jgi:hypothetical protein